MGSIFPDPATIYFALSSLQGIVFNRTGKHKLLWACFGAISGDHRAILKAPNLTATLLLAADSSELPQYSRPSLSQTMFPGHKAN